MAAACIGCMMPSGFAGHLQGNVQQHQWFKHQAWIPSGILHSMTTRHRLWVAWVFLKSWYMLAKLAAILFPNDGFACFPLILSCWWAWLPPSPSWSQDHTALQGLEVELLAGLLGSWGVDSGRGAVANTWHLPSPAISLGIFARKLWGLEEDFKALQEAFAPALQSVESDLMQTIHKDIQTAWISPI